MREWLVQLSKGKGSYETRHRTTREGQARILYEGYNVHSGFNKRLIDPDGNVVDRVLTNA